MQYFDITNSPNVFDKELAKRLGFKKIFNAGSEIEIVENLERQTKRPFLIFSGNPNIISTLIKYEGAIGILTNGETINQQILDKVRENKKLIVFNSYYLTISQKERVSKIYKLRKLFKEAYKAKVNSTIISLAPNPDYLLSFMQLFEIAKLIASDEHHAKKMLTNLGEILNDIQKKA